MSAPFIQRRKFSLSFVDLTEMTMKITVLWDVMCNMEGIRKHFRAIYLFHLRGRRYLPNCMASYPRNNGLHKVSDWYMNFGIISIKKCPYCRGVLVSETLPAVQSPHMHNGPVDGCVTSVEAREKLPTLHNPQYIPKSANMLFDKFVYR